VPSTAVIQQKYSLQCLGIPHFADYFETIWMFKINYCRGCAPCGSYQQPAVSHDLRPALSILIHSGWP
jgi:hypothetical protein